ncbi:MAG: T9SS type B sorting domain-containing protein, partial [Bacteroidia bacterium]
NVIVTDANGCVGSTSLTIAEPLALSHTVSAVQSENCNLSNGSATITEGGGTVNYSYQWSSGQTSAMVTNFPTGSYTVVVTDANGCKDSASVSIGNIPGPTSTVVQTTSVTCYNGNNGVATVFSTGGTGSINYTWSNGTTGAKDSNLVAGITYTVVTTDGAGCTFTSTVAIAGPTQITLTVTSTTVSCNGGNNGTATATAGGGFTPYIYTWSNAQTGATATGLTAGNYTVSVTDGNGCPADTSIAVVENPPVDTLQITAEICVNDPTAVLTAPSISSNSTHQWSLSGNAISGATGYTYLGNSAYASNYSVAWSYAGCNYTTSSVAVKYEADLGALPTSNIFTPNDDGINDEYTPFSIIDVGGTPTAVTQMMNDMISNYELTIFDRWGVLLFKTTTVTEMWNGKTTGGKECAAGNYYWIAKYKAKCSKNTGVQNIKGFVQLIR